MKKMLAGCVILKEDKILLLHRKKADWYELPGGKINGPELPEDTARRELKEELLCDVEIIKKIGFKNFKENGHIMGYTWFLARIKNGQSPQIGEAETFDSFKYMPIKKLSENKLSFNMRNLVQELTKGNIVLK